MALTAGTKLSHYEITSQIGKGGMGEVYRAKDQKLGRDVAIKVLPEEFAKDTDRIARFQREAKLLASLNHPNIAAIHGLEESDGTHFLILELIEGDTLADRLKRGAIPVEESLKLALQIAEALEAAHEKGVIHRDLKTANIKVTPDGKVKVLDFGLAKAFSGDQGDMNLSNSPTLSAAATKQGVILGTAAYMSPEQARGNPVDKRTDIWAFGVVLFEILTGRPIFTEDTVSDTLASVLKTEPDWQSLPPNLHPRIRLLLERCLKKEPKNRYHDIADARVDIQEALAVPDGVVVHPGNQTNPSRELKSRLICFAVLIIAVIGTGIIVWNLKESTRQKTVSFYYEIPAGQEFGEEAVFQPKLAVSSDGDQFAYCTTQGIYLRSMEDMEARIIPGAEGNAKQPFFSPDGDWIGYWSTADDELKKIRTSGGIPVPLRLMGDIPIAFLSWNSDDTIIYSTTTEGIRLIPADGGTPKTLIESKQQQFYSPRLLPDGETVLFTIGDDEGYKVAAESLKSGERTILATGSDAYYSPTGHLVYLYDKDLVASAIDLKRLEITGGAIPVVKDIFHTTGAPQFALSPSGTLVYSSGTIETGKRTLHWVKRNGDSELLEAVPDAYMNPRISPDGERIALSVSGPRSSSNIKIWDCVHNTFAPRNFESTLDTLPLWTPDSESILFFRQFESNTGISKMPAAVSGSRADIYTSNSIAVTPSCWGGDGKTLLIQITTTGGVSYDIGVLSEDGSELTPILQEKYNELQPQISPNGRWMAYTSDASGNHEIWVRPFPEVNTRDDQVSQNGGDSPLWSPDGLELFYRNGSDVISVPVKTDQDFWYGKPEILFQGAYVSSTLGVGPLELHSWDIDPSGKKFLMMKPAEGEGSATMIPRKINVVVNWFEKLKEKVPVD